MPAIDDRTWTSSHNWLTSHIPRPPSWSGVGRLRPTSGFAELSRVADVADHGAAIDPHLEHARAAAVDDAVGGDFVSGQHEVGGPGLVEPGLAPDLVDQHAQRGETTEVEDELGRAGGWIRERVIEWCTDRGEVPRRRVRLVQSDFEQERMGPAGLVHDIGGEVGGVVRTQQPPLASVGKGEVEQRFVAMALRQRRLAAVGGDRFADAS